MPRKPKVPLAGRLIITAIFALTIFIPEIVMFITLFHHPAAQQGSATSFVRLTLSAILYYFVMQGHGWARWLTAFLLIISGAMVIVAAGRSAPPVAIVAAILFVPSIAILLGLKIVRSEERIRRYRRSV